MRLSAPFFVGLMPFVLGQKLGRVSRDIFVLYDPEADRSHAPDLVFVATDHRDRIRDGKVWGAADLVFEVLSPSTQEEDRAAKFLAYQHAGIPWYWIVDPISFLIEECQLTPEGYLRSQTILERRAVPTGDLPGSGHRPRRPPIRLIEIEDRVLARVVRLS